MKHVNITCPYCHAKAYLRPATVVFGAKAPDLTAKYYVCAHYPLCDAYVAAHKKTLRPMGTLANAELRKKRKEAHLALDHLWRGGMMRRSEAYRLLQLHMGLPEEDTHIANFSFLRCEEVISFCKNFFSTTGRQAA